MQLLNRKATTYLIGAQVAALSVGYILRSPDLSATAARQASYRRQHTETAFERQEAISRAQTCLVLATELPITDGTAAYFSSTKGGRIVIHKNRPLPDGTGVCDAFGNTGIVATDAEGTPIISDIRRMPPEQMKEILSTRGVMPRPSSRPFAKPN
jgi:hypothetical protein